MDVTVRISLTDSDVDAIASDIGVARVRAEHVKQWLEIVASSRISERKRLDELIPLPPTQGRDGGRSPLRDEIRRQCGTVRHFSEMVGADPPNVSHVIAGRRGVPLHRRRLWAMALGADMGTIRDDDQDCEREDDEE